jgi:hypothetical protein
MMLTSAEIMQASAKTLFPGDEAAVKARFRSLAMKWHPDHNPAPEAIKVFEHIKLARDKALGLSVSPFVILTRDDGTKFKMEYIRAQSIEGMTIYTGETSIAYHVSEDYDDLIRRAGQNKWRFGDKKMEAEMTRFLPVFARTEKLVDGSLMIYRRSKTQILMSDLMALNGERIPPVHVTWMISRLVNIACYFEFAQKVHLALLPEFLLVDLDGHGVSITGPVLYLMAVGQHPTAAPNRTVEALPALRQKSTLASTKMDRQLIRETALTLLGDRGGTKIKNDPDVLPDVARWISSPPPASAYADYEAWEVARGPRKFAHYGKSAHDIYSS